MILFRMTYTQHRDTQEVLQTLDKLDMDDELMNNQVRILRECATLELF